jgi:hypothetical protein
MENIRCSKVERFGEALEYSMTQKLDEFGEGGGEVRQ